MRKNPVYSGINEKATQSVMGNPNDAEPIELEQPVSTKKFETDERALEALQRKNQVAIVGFWRVDEN